MDFDLSTQSVRSALSDLQLKVRLLEDERDHFHHLFLTTGRAFEDHRRELNLLLHKERAVASADEEKLRLELQRVLAENTLMHTRIVESKSEASVRIRTAVEEFRAQQLHSEDLLRTQIATVHDELLAARRRGAEIRDEKRAVEAEMAALLSNQSVLQRESDALQTTRNQLEEQGFVHERAEEKLRRSPLRPCRTPSAERQHHKVKKVFLPSGRVEAQTKRPATHNIHAVVQTLEHQSLLQPRPTDGSKTGRQLDGVCRGLISELLDMKREYAALTDRLGDPTVDSLEVSRRLRQLMYDIDRKTEQLRQLRRQQVRIDDDVRIHEMFKEILSEQDVYEGMHEELLRILRSAAS